MGAEEIRRIKEKSLLPKEKKVYRLNKVATKTLERKAKEAVEIDKGKELTSGGAELKRWFEDRRKELTGVCSHCGGRSCKDSDQYWKFSIAHILPKAYFPSVATHKDNFIELCFFNNSCHTQMDNKMLDIIDMNCWDTIVERFLRMYPFIAKDEKRRIPQTLMQYVQTDI